MPICWKCGRMGSTGQVSGGSIDVEGERPVFTGKWRCIDGRQECEARAKAREKRRKEKAKPTLFGVQYGDAGDAPLYYTVVR